MRFLITGVVVLTLIFVAIAFSEFIPTGKSYMRDAQDTGVSQSMRLPIAPSTPVRALTASRAKSNIFAGSFLLGQKSSSGLVHLHHDLVGSVVSETRQAGAEGIMEYLPFGRTIASDADTRYGFGGKEQDTTGLHYFSARYYQAGLGRFASRDPEIGTASLYAFVEHNPLIRTDPTGARIELAGPVEDRLRIAEDLGRLAGVPVGWEEIDGRSYALLSEGARSDRPQGLRLVSDVIESRHTVRVGLGDDIIPIVSLRQGVAMGTAGEFKEGKAFGIDSFAPAFDIRLEWTRFGPVLTSTMTQSGVSEIRYITEGNMHEARHDIIYFYPDYREPAHHDPGFLTLGHELGHAWGYFQPHPLFGEPASWLVWRIPQVPSSLDGIFGMGLRWENRIRAEENAAASQEVYPRRGRY